jgi:hypothetical protein
MITGCCSNRLAVESARQGVEELIAQNRTKIQIYRYREIDRNDGTGQTVKGGERYLAATYIARISRDPGDLQIEGDREIGLIEQQDYYLLLRYNNPVKKGDEVHCKDIDGNESVYTVGLPYAGIIFNEVWIRKAPLIDNSNKG